MNLYKSLFFSQILSLFFFVTNVQSQNLNFKHYGLPEGLPQETIHCITKDSQGFYWLGTSDGLVRFDGHDFITPEYHTAKITLDGLLINDIVEDNKHNIWIATSQNGVFRYDYISELLTPVGVKNSNATSIIYTQKGQIFVSYFTNGLYQIIQENGKFISKKIQFNNFDDSQITTFEHTKNHFVLGTNTGELFLFNNLKLKKTAIQKIQTDFELGKINNIVSIQNQVFICATNGLFKLSEDLKSVIKIPLHKIIPNQKKAFSVYDIVAKNNTYYIATDNGLLELLKKHKFKLLKQYISKQKYDIHTPNNNVINDLFIDDDLLLLGGNNLDIATITKNKIINLINTELQVGNPSVFSFEKYKDKLFIATTSGLLVQDANKKYTKIPLPINRIRTITLDNDSNLWVAALNKIFIIPLDYLDINNPYFITISPFSEKNGNTIIRRLYKDNKGTIWIATNGDGLYQFTGNIAKNDFNYRIFKPNNSKNSLPSGFIIGISQDANHNFWLSTQTGLSKLSFDENTYDNPKFTNYFKGENGLKTNGILSTFTDSDKQLWIATRKGLHLYKENKFIHFGKKEGLTNTFVYNILEDNLGNLWLSTNGGIFRFNKATKKFTNYTVKDGLQSSEFNLGAAYKDTETGELYFGGINGFNYFNPNEMDKLDKEGNLCFTNISIKDKNVSPLNSSILNKSISNTESVELNYTDFPVNLNFSALDYRPNSNISYAYKLLPDDTQWNILKDKNSLQLLSLSPKSYTLQIQGMSRGNLWKKAPLELKISVNPPWYRSVLAYLLYILLFLGIVYFIYNSSLQRKLAGQEAKRLQDLDDLKAKFITNITHEFRTPLTIILGFVDSLKEQFSAKKETLSTLNTIEQNGNNLLDLVNQMLDLSKLEKGSLSLNLIQSDIVAYLNHLLQSFSNIAKTKKINLQFASDVAVLKMDFDAEKIRQIFTNLISNALKFSKENTTVTLKIKRNNNHLEITIIDEGFGIPATEIDQIFDRFYQVDNSEFKVSQGTGIGLSLTKELVLLMQGTIQVTSKINKGTTFTICLPISCNEENKQITNLNIPLKHTNVPELNQNIALEDTNTVLVVEDNPDMSRYIVSCLAPTFKTIVASNGKQGLEIATNQIPDVIVTDVMMPIMDGYELTSILQKNEITNHIPIIMLTSKAMQDEKNIGLSSGADAYLTKPFNKKELIIRIENLIEKRTRLQQKFQEHKTPCVNKISENVKDKNSLFLNKISCSIERNIENTEFNSYKLAAELSVSESQLYRKLKAITNYSTAVYIRKIRLLKAKEMLEKTGLTVSEIAYKTGFNDPNWFSRIFKKEFGVTPNDTRK